MKNIQLSILLLLFFINPLFSQDCKQATSQVELSGDNVKMKLTMTNLWWDGNDVQYVFPKDQEASSVFTGTFWISAVNEADEFLIAAQMYGIGSGISDYWPGPFGDATSCQNWNRHFVTSKNEVNTFIEDFNNGNIQTVEDVSLNLRGWPANGNPHFASVNNFELSENPAGYADFFDNDQDGLYDPLQGDYPALNGAEEMAWWVINDYGNIHTESRGDALTFQLQFTASTFSDTDPAINNSTIYKVKLTNMADELRKDCTFSLWIDSDVGCSEDDYVGCLPENNLIFFYNEDEIDGSSGSNCTGGVPTYGENPPLMGVKLVKGFLNSEGEELDMSAFTVLNASSTEYTNLTTPFAFVGNPADPESGSMCSSSLEIPQADRRTLTSYGNFDLAPGQSNEMIFSLTGVENSATLCPDISELKAYTNRVKDYVIEQRVLTSVSTDQILVNSSDVLIYPNPLSDGNELSIQMKNHTENISSLRVIDLLGKTRLSFEDINSTEFRINKTALKKGISFIELKGESGKIFLSKVVVQ